jgi:hypothetical protein
MKGEQMRTGPLSKLALAILASGSFTVSACDDGTDGQCGSPTAVQTRGGISVNNDPCALEAQVDRTQKDVPIEPTGDPAPASLPEGYLAAKAPPAATLTLIATVAPPVVGGMSLQATGITLEGSYAVVTYMMTGEPALGAIDLISTAVPNSPQLVSRATFTDSDVLGGDIHNGYLWFVGATPESMQPYRAFLQGVTVVNNRFDLSWTVQTGLPSYAGTSVSVDSTGRIYVTSGNAGGVMAYSFANGALTQLMDYPLSDARGVHANESRVAVVTGMPGTLTVFDQGKSGPLGQYAFPGADVPESKTTVEIYNGMAFVAAGTAGLQVLGLTSGKVLASVPRPDPAALGLDPAWVTTNSVSAYGDLIFMCNGSAGVSVVSGGSSIGSKNQSLTVLGQLKLGSGYSANHLAYRDKYLMVATGRGGLKIVRVDTN